MRGVQGFEFEEEEKNPKIKQLLSNAAVRSIHSNMDWKRGKKGGQ